MPTDQDDKELDAVAKTRNLNEKRRLAETRTALEYQLAQQRMDRKDQVLHEAPTPEKITEWFIGVDPAQRGKDRTEGIVVERRREGTVSDPDTPSSPQATREGLLAQLKRWEGEIYRLERELAETRSELADRESRLRTLNRDLDGYIIKQSELTNRIGDLQKVVDANEARERLRKPGIEVHEVGAKVVIEDWVHGRVDSVSIEESGIFYRVSWWTDRNRSTAIFSAPLVRVDDDHLPYPGEQPSGSVGRDPS